MTRGELGVVTGYALIKQDMRFDGENNGMAVLEAVIDLVENRKDTGFWAVFYMGKSLTVINNSAIIE